MSRELTRALPEGTVSFLFTDIEGSTQLVHQLRDEYPNLISEHNNLLRSSFDRWSGTEVDSQGDAFFFTFPTSRTAVAAAAEAQKALAVHEWPSEADVRVRMGIHTGEPLVEGSSYFGMDVHRAARVGCAGHGGQVLLSETTSALVWDDLPKDASLLDMGFYQLKDMQHQEHIYQLVVEGLPWRFPPLKAASTVSPTDSFDMLLPTTAEKIVSSPVHNLPSQISSFVGRAEELSRVSELILDPGVRLVTLVGPPGTGKTRLAIETARSSFDAFGGSVIFVKLAPESREKRVAARIARAVGVETANGTEASTLDALCLALTGKKLLVLDNCEHLIEDVEAVSRELLARSANLTILATSRQPLGLPGELIFSVEPLYIPEDGDTFEQLSVSEAVELFSARAKAADPSFLLSHENIGLVAQICRQLDGLPLAIELIATQMRVSSIDDIFERLTGREDLVIEEGILGGPKTRALESSIRWSYDLLNDDEKKLFTRLAVFRGGFTLEHAQHMMPQDEATRTQTHNYLSRLVDRSMIYLQRTDEISRYSLLESLRLFGLKKLGESSELEDAQTRHTDVFLALAETLSERLFGESAPEAMNALDEDVDNLLFAMENSLHLDRTSVALRIAGVLRIYWIVRPQLWQTMLDLLNEIIESDKDHSSPADLARAYRTMSILASRIGSQSKSNRIFHEGLEHAIESEDTEIMADYAAGQGWIHLREGDNDSALELFEKSEVLAREADSPLVESWANYGIAFAVRDDTDQKLGYSIRAFELAEEAGSQLDIGAALNGLGHLYGQKGEYEKAAEAFTHALSNNSMIKNKGVQSLCLINLGVLMEIQGFYERANEKYLESLSLAQGIGYQEGLLWACVCLGEIFRIYGQHLVAEDYLKQCELFWDRLHIEGGKTDALVEYSLLMRDIDDLTKAKRLIDDALAGVQTHHYSADVSRCKWAAGTIYYRQEDLKSALRFYLDSMDEKNFRSHSSSLCSLEGIAIILSQSEKGKRAVSILSSVDSLRTISGAVAEPVEQAQVDDTLAILKQNMQDQEFANAWQNGESMNLEETKRFATEAVAELID